MEIFAERLKDLRIDKNLSLRQLANELQIRDTTIGRWERMLRVPNIIELKKIAEFFGVSADYLLGLQDL